MLGGAEPSANGAAALALSRLATLCDREDLGARADAILQRYRSVLARAPRALGLEAQAAAWRTGQTRELAIIGDANDPRTQALLATARRTHTGPMVLTCVAAADMDQATSTRPWLAGKVAIDGQPTAYLCEGWSCQAPVTDPAMLHAQLSLDTADQQSGTRDHAPALPTDCLLYTSPSPRDLSTSRMPSSA